MNLGYACINMELNARKGVDRVTTNRSMIKKTFQEKGLDYASELIIQNKALMSNAPKRVDSGAALYNGSPRMHIRSRG